MDPQVMSDAATQRRQYQVGDIVEVKAPTTLIRRSSKTEDRLHVAHINFFDALISTKEKYSGKRFAVIMQIHEEYNLVQVYPLSPRNEKRDWFQLPPPYVIEAEKEISAGLNEDFIVVPHRMNIQIKFISKKIGVSLEAVAKTESDSSPNS